MKKFWLDFKDFAMKGNVVDMAVGVVVGSAFGKIVSSLVADIITPLISLILGKMSLADLKWVMQPAVLDDAGKVLQNEVALTYGNFIQSVIDFLIIAFSIFVVMRALMNLKNKFTEAKEKEAEQIKEEAEEPSKELETLCEIRDLLKEKSEADK